MDKEDFYIVRFYFTSRKSVDVKYKKFKFDELMKFLKDKSWNDIIITSEYLGINFSQVTHYEVWKQ